MSTTSDCGPTFNLTHYQQFESNGLKFLETSEPKDTIGYLMSSPKPVFCFTLAYLAIVCFIGPKFMQNRQPFKLFTLIRFYNLIMVLLAGYLVYCLEDAVGSVNYFFNCDKTFNLNDESATKIYRISNFLLMVRVSEYLDTIFFTLRKKEQQITFLHVFHHAFVPVYAYWVLRTAPLRFNTFIIILNSFVHVIMYFYYFISTFQGESKSITMIVISKLLLFKRYMTQMQIMQFVSLAVYVFWATLQPNQCKVPKVYIFANLFVALGFLGLFLHFYIKEYTKKPKLITSSSSKAKKLV